MSLDRSVGVDTAALRTSADTSLETSDKFLKSYEQLKDAVENSTITGPVYDAAVTALKEKEQFVEELRAKLNDNADYSEERADAGDQLIKNLSDDML